MFVENAIYISPVDDCYVTVRGRKQGMVKILGLMQGRHPEFIRKITIKDFCKDYTMVPRSDAASILRKYPCPIFRTAALKAYDAWCETPDLGQDEMSEQYSIIKNTAMVEFKVIYTDPETRKVIFRGEAFGTYVNGGFQAENIPVMTGMRTLTRVTHWRYRGVCFPLWTEEDEVSQST